MLTVAPTCKLSKKFPYKRQHTWFLTWFSVNEFHMLTVTRSVHISDILMSSHNFCYISRISSLMSASLCNTSKWSMLINNGQHMPRLLWMLNFTRLTSRCLEYVKLTLSYRSLTANISIIEQKIILFKTSLSHSCRYVGTHSQRYHGGSQRSTYASCYGSLFFLTVCCRNVLFTFLCVCKKVQLALPWRLATVNIKIVE